MAAVGTDIYNLAVAYDEQVEALVQAVQLVRENPTDAKFKGEANEQIKKCHEAKRFLGFELSSGVKDKETKTMYTERKKEMDRRVHELTKDLEDALASAARAALFGVDGERQGGSLGADDVYLRDTKGKGNQELLDSAGRVQDLTQFSLTRTQQTIQQTKLIANLTLEDLEDQKQQIAGISEELHTMGDKLTSADSRVREFVRGIWGDNIIKGFMIVNSILVIAIVGYVLSKDGTF